MAIALTNYKKIRCAIAVSSFDEKDWFIPVVRSLVAAGHIEMTCCLLIDQKSHQFAAVELRGIEAAGSVLRLVTHPISNSKDQKCIDQFSSLDIDFVMNFSGILPDHEWNESTNFGFWQFRFGEQIKFEMTGVYELNSSQALQEVSLVRYSPYSRLSQVLKIGRLRLRGEPLRRHRKTILQHCQDWPTQVSKQIFQRGSISATTLDFFKQKDLTLANYISAWCLAELGFFLALLSRVWVQFFFQQWNIGVIQLSLGEVLKKESLNDVLWWKPLDSPMCLADPFPILEGNKVHILAEKFSCVQNIGSISCFSLNAKGELESEHEAIRSPHHRSYPCVVSENGENFMTCEALETKELVVLRCEKFPGRWVRHSVVASDRPYSDPTMFQYKKRWWVFATAYDIFSAGNSTLYAWYSDDGLAGPWKGHALNPIKCDVTSSRSAGSPFFSEGRFYRPAQDCSWQYGRAIVINEILQLDPVHFHEYQVKTIEAHPKFPNGIHHISGLGNLTFVDGRRDFFSPKIALLKILRLFKKKPKASGAIIASTFVDSLPDMASPSLQKEFADSEIR